MSSLTMMLKQEDVDSPEKRGNFTVTVVGCGRMGIPTACLFAEAGFKVICVDVDQGVVALLKKGKTPLAEPGLEELVKKHTNEGRLTVTNNCKEAASASDVIMFTVPTLIDKKRKPDYLSVEKACREVGMGLRSGCLVIFESTVGPGLTESLVKETLENASGLKAGSDFGLAYSPIRATSGQVLQNIASYARIVGAVNERSLEVACLVLGTITKGEIIKVRDMKTAEAVKLFENVQRDVNIALANEFAQFCEKAGIDYEEARKTANTQPYCHLLVPGIVGGHIPKDAYLLVDEADSLNASLHMVTLARKVNDEMLDHTLRLVRDALRACGKPLRRARVSVLGVSYRPNIKEAQVSLIKELVNILKRRGAFVKVYDPLFSAKELVEMGYPAEDTLTKAVEGADCLIIAVGHDQFKRLNLKKAKLLMKKSAAIVDVGHVIEPARAEKENLVYRGLGRGVWTR